MGHSMYGEPEALYDKGEVPLCEQASQAEHSGIIVHMSYWHGREPRHATYSRGHKRKLRELRGPA